MATSVTLYARGDRHVISSSDDNALMKNILATHSPDGTCIDVVSLLQIVDNIMHMATPNGPQANIDVITESVNFGDVNEMLKVLALTINKVSCETTCKCSGGGDTHATTIGIFNALSNYGWDAKAAITLAAFAVNYGEFWLVAQLLTTNPLAKSLAFLKQLPAGLENSEPHQQRFNVVTSFVKALLDLTDTIYKFKGLPEKYISPDTPELVTATTHIPTAVYWIMRSIVACASVLTNLIGMGHGHIVETTEANWELSGLFHKIGSIHDHLKQQLDRCIQIIDEKKHYEIYLTIIHTMDVATHVDNTKPLSVLISLKDNKLPLFDGSTQKQVGIEILKKKFVLLLISDLDINPSEELSFLNQMYKEARETPTKPESQYEVVWLPVLPNQTTMSKEDQIKFEKLRQNMTWYSVFDPSLLDPAVIRYIKEVWHFNQKPLLVVMNPQGKIVNTNALHMMWTWGSNSFPFTSSAEEDLWQGQTWSMELLFDSKEPIVTWINEKKYICLYGGEDIEWIQNFTTKIQQVVSLTGIELEMLYVGKSNPGEKIRKNIDFIKDNYPSQVLLDTTKIRSFWVRLENMLHSKLQHGKSSDADAILKEINVMLTYDGNGKGWAVISHGSDDWMNRVNGDTLLASLNTFDDWKDKVNKDNLLLELNSQLEVNRSPHHCNRLILPGTTGSVPDTVVCADCGKSMEMYYMYRCCTD